MNVIRGLVGMVAALAMAAAAAGAVLPAPAPAVPTLRALDALIQAEPQLDRGGFGAVVFTARGPVWNGTGGASAGAIPFGMHTPLMVGELSGRFVLLAAARLADRGRVDFRRPLRAYLPELDAARGAKGHLPDLAQLNLGLLASEATGRVDTLPRLVPGYRLQRDLLPALAARDALFQPGLRQTRSCGATDLLALLMERTCRRPWQRVVATEALAPLGMARSAFVTPAQAQRLAFYFRDGARCDPRLLESLVPPLSPGLSLRSDLGDLAACGASLLAACAGRPGPLSPRVARTVLAPALPGQLDRQGFATGLGWNLTDYRLGYLGRVAWAYGLAVTHQSLVMLLPDQGLGVALGEIRHDPTGLFEFKRIARSLLQTYAERELGLPRPVFHVPSELLPIPAADRPAAGLYASAAGVAEAGFQGDLLTVSVRGGYGEFTWTGPGRFLPVEENEFAEVQCADAQLTVSWRSGARAILDLVAPVDLPLALEPGALRIEGHGSVQQRGTALISPQAGSWTITADDGQSYLLVPDPPAAVAILCDEGSALYGCRITAGPAGALHLKAP